MDVSEWSSLFSLVSLCFYLAFLCSSMWLIIYFAFHMASVGDFNWCFYLIFKLFHCL